MSFEFFVFLLFLADCLIGALFYSLGKTITLRKDDSSIKVNTNYSFFSLLFGFFYIIYRRDFHLLKLYIIITVLTLGIFSLVFPFIYNRWYIRDLINDGYKTEDEEILNYLIDNKIIKKVNP